MADFRLILLLVCVLFTSVKAGFSGWFKHLNPAPIFNPDRGEWLQTKVADFAAQHQGKNVIGFKDGSYNFTGPLSVEDLQFEEYGCQYSDDIGGAVGGLVGAVMGGSVGPGAVILGAVGTVIGSAVGERVGKCPAFKLVEFVSGYFDRIGDGGFENWVFQGDFERVTDTHVDFYEIE